MSFAALAAQITRHAVRLAEARAEQRLRARRKPGSPWRRAALLWPLFVPGER